ncbi:MAG: MMPL family transporter [Desulfobacterales bacterium]|nr:MMPL family transporter [Desulfobacterales bacterium]
MNNSRTHYPLLLLVLIGAAVLFAIGWQRVTIDTDIVNSLPRKDPVIADAVHIFRHHPLQDQLTIDIGMDGNDPDVLTAIGRMVAQELTQSGLFKTVGMADIQRHLPQLAGYIVHNLPVLFTQLELETRILPGLKPEQVAHALREMRAGLLQMSGIGQAAYLARDPLGLKNLVLSKLIHMAPTQTARIYQGQLISGDGRHLLMTATPAGSSTDTAMACRLSENLAQISDRVRQAFEPRGVQVTLTPVGAYRAALDNEMIVRADVQHAVWFATAGVAMLLLFAFPRPILGLLSLLPAVAGILTAFFIMTLMYPSISIMVLGFGGAIISITVDHGIVYLLFLDRPHTSYGKEASREVQACGLLATLTTVGAFAALSFSGFSIFQQLGQFAALGISLSFLFVHTVFPRIFPVLGPARQRRLPLHEAADRLFSFGPKGAWAALVFCIVMAFFAKPEFNANLSAMNTVSRETQQAEQKLVSVWGDIFGKVFLMTEADSIGELQKKGDQLLSLLTEDADAELPDRAFLPAMIFPGFDRRAANLAAWKSFWTERRIADLKAALQAGSRNLGFKPDAFAAFYDLLADPENAIRPAAGIPAEYFGLMGISRDADNGKWRQFTSLALPGDYGGDRFYERYHSAARIFDPSLFSRQLGSLFFHTFSKLLVIIAPVVVVLLLVFFLDVSLTLIALAPVVFAMTATLGSMHLMGRPLDIPALMLTIVVLGMGIDYSLYLVCSYQHYGTISHPSFALIRAAIFMAAASTMIGFGVMVTAHHSLLQSIGVVSFLGIGYSVVGAFLILPPLLKWYFEDRRPVAAVPGDRRERVLLRYRGMTPYARMFARFKLRLDPMFTELPELTEFKDPPQTLVDIGSGFGVPACWLLETFPQANIYGIEPAADRVQVAKRAVNGRGEVICGRAPDLPPAPFPVDGAFMLDMMHFLPDVQLRATLTGLNGLMVSGGRLLIRSVMVPTRRMAFGWWMEHLKQKLNGVPTFYRSGDDIRAILTQCGFSVQCVRPSGYDGELIWFKSTKADGELLPPHAVASYAILD